MEAVKASMLERASGILSKSTSGAALLLEGTAAKGSFDGLDEYVSFFSALLLEEFGALVKQVSQPLNDCFSKDHLPLTES